MYFLPLPPYVFLRQLGALVSADPTDLIVCRTAAADDPMCRFESCDEINLDLNEMHFFFVLSSEHISLFVLAHAMPFGTFLQDFLKAAAPVVLYFMTH